MKTPFWAVRHASQRKTFEVVRVINYSSSKVVIDRRVGTLYYGPTNIMEKHKEISYSAFKKNYKSINTLPDEFKYNLLKSAFLEKR